MTELLFENKNNIKLCFNTLLEKDGLFDKRNYEVHNKYKSLDFDTINNNSYYDIISRCKNDSSKYIYVYFINTTNFMSKSNKSKYGSLFDIEKKIKEFYNINSNLKININIIIVLTRSYKLNIQILEKKVIEKLNIKNVQIFLYNNLLFNISKHNLIPKHIRVVSNPKDIKEICELKNITKEQLPKIQLRDPLAIFYGIKKGELFEFKRTSQNSGEYVYYRLCVT